MSHWGSAKAQLYYESAGTLNEKLEGSHRILARPGWPDFVFSFHDAEEIGPRMLAKISKKTGLEPEDL
jgi:predicted RNA binding protein YcfA (HicA-like mRNA interferase family)